MVRGFEFYERAMSINPKRHERSIVSLWGGHRTTSCATESNLGHSWRGFAMTLEEHH